MSTKANQLLPPPPLPDETSLVDRARAWIDLENSCQALLMAGLRREIGPQGNLDQAHRDWYENYCEQKTHALVKMAENFTRRRRRHG